MVGSYILIFLPVRKTASDRFVFPNSPKEPCWGVRNPERMYFSRKKEWKCELFYDLSRVLVAELLLRQAHQCAAVQEAAVVLSLFNTRQML